MGHFLEQPVVQLCKPHGSSKIGIFIGVTFKYYDYKTDKWVAAAPSIEDGTAPPPLGSTCNSLDFSGVRDEWLSGGDSKDVCLWDGSTLELKHRFAFRKKITQALFVAAAPDSPGEMILVVDKFGNARIFNMEELAEVDRVTRASRKRHEETRGKKVAPPLNILSDEDEDSEDDDVVEYNSWSLGCLSTVTRVVCIYDTNSNIKYICFGDRDEKIRVCRHPQIEDIHCILMAHTSYIADMCSVSIADQQYLVSSAADGSIKWWNIETGVCMGTLSFGKDGKGNQLIPFRIQPVAGDGQVVVAFLNSTSLSYVQISETAASVRDTHELGFLPSAMLCDSELDAIWVTDMNGRLHPPIAPGRTVPEHKKDQWAHLLSTDNQSQICNSEVPKVLYWKHMNDIPEAERREKRLRHTTSLKS